MNPAIQELPDHQARLDALEPASCIVQAPAGSGKTTLLATRYIRLLSLVDKPQEILAITFTKKAAAEMRHRVLQMLSSDDEWSRRARARNEALGWGIFKNPNVLKIQTIDSFAMDLASQSHDSASLGQVDIVENASNLYENAAHRLLDQLLEGAPTASLIADFLALHDNDMHATVRLISTMLGKRDQWLDLTREISTNLDAAPRYLKKVVGGAIEHIHTQSEERLHQNTSEADRGYFERFATDPLNPWSSIPALMKKDGKLRRRFTSKDGVGNSEQVREVNQWLVSLHDRGVAPLCEQHYRIPPELDSQELESLTLSAIVLTLAAGELKDLFNDSNSIDFVELLVSAKHALRDIDGGATDLALLLDYRIKHLLVDEYQDTSRPQFEFFSLLAESWRHEDGNTVFAVGDPMQSIYRFRDADVRIFSETVRGGMQSIALRPYQLTANFRSDAAIVDWCNDVFASLFAAPSSNTASDSPSLSPPHSLAYTPAVPMQTSPTSANMHDIVRCYRFEDSIREANYIASSIQDLIEAQPDCEIAILCRARTHLVPILDQLKTRSIAWQAADIDPLAQEPLVGDLHSALLVLMRSNHQLAVTSILRSPMIGLSLVELSELPDVQLDTLRQFGEQDMRVHRFVTACDWAVGKLHQRSISEVLQGFWLRLGGTEAYPRSSWALANAYLRLLDRYGRGQVNFEDLERDLADLYAPSADRANVQIMTIHKSKGLEFEHVFVPALSHKTRSDDPELISIEQHPSGLIMGTRGHAVHNWLAYEAREKAKAEEKRLLYVACTRAKHSLTLTWAQEPEKNANGLARYLEAQVEDRYADPTPRSVLVAREPDFLQADLFNTHLRQRIAKDFVWTDESDTHSQARSNDLVANRLEIATGTLVHKALAYLSGREVDAVTLERLPTLLEHWQETDADRQVVPVALAQVQRFVETDIGQWCLRKHQDAVAEYPMTGVVDGELVHVVIDRMFVESGVRWILDYKSTQADSDSSLELTARYRSQLELYAEICSNYFKEPIRTALILTNTAERLEIE